MRARLLLIVWTVASSVGLSAASFTNSVTSATLVVEFESGEFPVKLTVSGLSAVPRGFELHAAADSDTFSPFLATGFPQTRYASAVLWNVAERRVVTEEGGVYLGSLLVDVEGQAIGAGYVGGLNVEEVVAVSGHAEFQELKASIWVVIILLGLSYGYFLRCSWRNGR